MKEANSLELIDAASFARDALDEAHHLFTIIERRVEQMDPEEIRTLCAIGARVTSEHRSELEAALTADDEAAEAA